MDYHICAEPLLGDNEGVPTARCPHLDGCLIVGVGLTKAAAVADLNRGLENYQLQMT